MLCTGHHLRWNPPASTREGRSLNNSKPTQATAVVLAFTASFLWASSFIYIEIGLDDLEPMTFAALRYIIGAASLAIYWLYKGGAGARTIAGNDALLVVLLGVLLYAAVPAMQFIGLDQTDPVTFNFVFQAGIPLVLAASAGTLSGARPTRSLRRNLP